MEVSVDGSQVRRSLSRIQSERITRGCDFWERISNPQAFLLEQVWAPAAGRVMSKLEFQTDPSDFAGVVNTLEDLRSLEVALSQSLQAVPPAYVVNKDQVEPWIDAFSERVNDLQHGCPKGVTDKAISQVRMVVTGVRRTGWLDSDDSLQGWIRFEVARVP